MVKRLTTQGDTAVPEDRFSFDIETEEGNAIIRPTTPAWLIGPLHFVINTSSARNTDLSDVEVNFSGRSASVDSVVILQDGEKIFGEYHLEKPDSFVLSIPPGQATLSGDEITVSISVVFDEIVSNIKVSSVSVGL
ncbi:uncharacterized protein B0J16DRAFT_369992 [Fusarium flagelliforme]|uniref:Uncharacterized protein n=1 Tax=Fusarium flagelliforme TaxID=2675880 RepID=A0A395N3C8_9HYPO|nr:uncharacterized protein B0J16DRAFT_369992 [Fusarium flagelliforme]KAH7193957.1 hypothetical protein B0J16DRAFT_369992 [Fusarium flagelliforme]RFN54450.1 hypothetical protein FIE12Z_1238 [Fusarium flagelliforme]